MGLFILLAFIGMPILEIAVFIDVGERIGLLNTIAIVILTAIAGTALLRWQGLSVLGRAQESLRENRFPMEEVFDGLCLVFAGALLLTPGFVTDGIGFLLFAPPVRQLLKRVGVRFVSKRAHAFQSSQSRSPYGPANNVVDGEYVDITETKDSPPDDVGLIDHDPKQ